MEIFEPSDGADSSIPNQSGNYSDGDVWEEDDVSSGPATSEWLRDTDTELFGRSGKRTSDLRRKIRWCQQDGEGWGEQKPRSLPARSLATFSVEQGQRAPGPFAQDECVVRKWRQWVWATLYGVERSPSGFLVRIGNSWTWRKRGSHWWIIISYMAASYWVLPFRFASLVFLIIPMILLFFCNGK